jgi:hypothetical protein
LPAFHPLPRAGKNLHTEAPKKKRSKVSAQQSGGSQSRTSRAGIGEQAQQAGFRIACLGNSGDPV